MKSNIKDIAPILWTGLEPLMGYKYNGAEVFCDMIEYLYQCFAYARDEDDMKSVERLKSRYGKDYSAFPVIFQKFVLEMGSRVTSDKSWFDVLGEIYMDISSAYKSQLGQFFTPPEICDLSTMLNGGANETGKRVLDPACGSGRMLLSFHAMNPGNFVFGADLDIICVKMTIVNLCIHGCQGEVGHMDSLGNKIFSAWKIQPLAWVKIPKEQSRLYENPALASKPEPPKARPVQAQREKTEPGVQLTLF